MDDADAGNTRPEDMDREEDGGGGGGSNGRATIVKLSAPGTLPHTVENRSSKVGVLDETDDAQKRNKDDVEEKENGKLIRRKKSGDVKSGKKTKSGKKGQIDAEIEDTKMRTENEWEEEDEASSDSGDDTLLLFDPEKQTNNKPFRLTVSDAFEAFLIEKLFPCLEFNPGMYIIMYCPISIFLRIVLIDG